MKKLFVLTGLILLLSMPLNALGPSFGIKGGADLQMTEYDGVSDSQWWPSFGGVAEISFPMMPLSFRADLGYAWHSENDITFTDLSLGLAGKMNFAPPLSPIGFYLGAGPGMHIVSSDIEGSESENYFAIYAFGGAELKMMLNLFAEVGYSYLFPDEGSWSQVNLKAGMKF